jgi:DNA-binding NarL/FixJ family response regulator
VRLLGAAETLRNAIDSARPPTHRQRRDQAMDTARVALGPARLESTFAVGLATSAGQALKEVEQLVANTAAEAHALLPSTPFGFTRREGEVADLLAQGLTNREIGQALVLSERTVETHVTHLLGKLGVRSRAQAAVRLTSAN